MLPCLPELLHLQSSLQGENLAKVVDLSLANPNEA